MNFQVINVQSLAKKRSKFEYYAQICHQNLKKKKTKKTALLINNFEKKKVMKSKFTGRRGRCWSRARRHCLSCRDAAGKADRRWRRTSSSPARRHQHRCSSTGNGTPVPAPVSSPHSKISSSKLIHSIKS